MVRRGASPTSSPPEPAGFLGWDHRLGHLVEHLAVAAGRGSGQHHGLRVVRFGQRAQHVEVLVEQHHVVHGIDVHAHFLQALDLVDDAVGDLATVVGLAFALQTHLLRLRGGLRLDLDAHGLRALARGLFFALGGVDRIHRRLDLRARVDRRDQCLDHGETEAGHLVAHGLLHVGRHIVFARERVIERERGDRRTQRVLHVRTQLSLRVTQFVVGLRHVLGVHAVLRRGHDLHEHVVERLRFDLHVELRDAHVRLYRDAVDQRQLAVDAGELDRMEFAEPFDDVRLLLRHHIRGAHQHDDDEHSDDHKCDCHGISFSARPRWPQVSLPAIVAMASKRARPLPTSWTGVTLESRSPFAGAHITYLVVSSSTTPPSTTMSSGFAASP